ncbi:MAG: ferredoxin-thioredoxin reductase catalytic domain-containing protein [Elusimicrobiota bacterium]
MSNTDEITQEQVELFYKKLKSDAETNGYLLNPDTGFVYDLIRGLLTNIQRYGYQACPCRLASGNKTADLDLICPCDYRDSDLNDYDACYCALYITKDVAEGKKKLSSIPDRRLNEEQRNLRNSGQTETAGKPLPYPVWRCKVCGYLAARTDPPGVCPVCKATKERFERFM